MKRVGSLAIVLSLLVSLSSLAQDSSGAVVTEAQRTVKAFAGHWNMSCTDKASGAAEIVKFQVTLDCAVTSLGAAVDCHFKGDVPGAGPLEATAVIGYSPEEERVRWMEISSTGEYHDHIGQWQGESLAFQPLRFAMAGEPATEHLNLTFRADAMTFSAVTETTGGDDTLQCSALRTHLD